MIYMFIVNIALDNVILLIIRDLFDKKNINDVKVLYGSSEPNLFNF